MANEPNRDQRDNMDENIGGAPGDRQDESSPERLGGRSDENLRGIADDTDEEFEDTDDLDDEEAEDEGDGTV